MMIRLTRPWSNWSKGHVIPDMPGGQARTLIDRGIAEQVSDDARPMRAPMNRMAKPRAARRQQTA